MAIDRAFSPVRSALSWPDQLISRFVWSRFKVNRCEVEGETIVFYKNRSNFRRIHASEIASWETHLEMCFDVVIIRLQNGETIQWLDKYNDSLVALRTLARSKERLV